MQVICTDGTTFSCESYELTDYGVMAYSEPHEPDEDRYETAPDQMAYVPHDRLWYILPDGVAPNVPGLPVAREQVDHGRRPVQGGAPGHDTVSDPAGRSGPSPGRR